MNVSIFRARFVWKYHPSSTKLQIRHYDRKRYLKEKKAAKESGDKITLSECISTLKDYSLGQSLPITAHVNLTEALARPLRVVALKNTLPVQYLY
jgi:hypothetical protein